MGRAPCCDKNGQKKGPWTPEEDQKLIDFIQKHGYGNWRTLPKNAGLQRCGKSCRLRWTNYLRPDIKRGRFSFEEEETIIQLHSILGNKWSAIAARLPGRTDNEIKNYWNTHIRKRLLRMGIDPVTHSPRLDLLDLSSILSSALYNSAPHMNLSRLLGVQQPIVNPEILRLATSLMSSQQVENHTNFPQNYQENQLYNSHPFQEMDQPNNHPLENQLLNQVQELPSTTPLTTSCVDPFQNMEHFQQSDFTNISSQNAQLIDQWETNVSEDNYMPIRSCNYYVPSHTEHAAYIDTSDTSTFQSNSNQSNQNFSLASVLSTPSSSPATINSNSTYVNSTTSTEDELQESYCSSMMKFEIPDILDVSEFMLGCGKIG